MRMAPFYVLCSLALSSCGGDEEYATNSEENDLTIKAKIDSFRSLANNEQISKNTKTEMVWDIVDGCQLPGSSIAFYDIDGTDVWGPHPLTAYMGHFYFKLQCVMGHRICYGAWRVDKSFYDCSKAQKTFTCFYVQEELFDPWGCGKDCRRGYSKWDCYECWPGIEKNKTIACGD